MFDQTKTVALHGTLRELQWTNPHCFIRLMVDGTGGMEYPDGLPAGPVSAWLETQDTETGRQDCHRDSSHEGRLA